MKSSPTPFALLAVLLLATGCKQDVPATATAAATLPAETESPRRATARLPTFVDTYRTDTRFAAASWPELLAALTPEERAYLDRTNDNYHGALEYRDATERAAMAKLGIPTASELLSAARLSDAELKALADAADEKGKLLYSNRLIDNAQAVTEAPDGMSGAREQERVNAGVAAFVEVGKLRQSRNPFVAYMDGRMHYKLAPNHPAETYAAALMIGGAWGDTRSHRLVNDFSAQAGAMDAASLIASYNSYTVGR